MRGVELPTQSDMIACLRLDGFVFSFCLTSLFFQTFLQVRPDTRRSSKTMGIACVRFFYSTDCPSCQSTDSVKTLKE